MKPNNFPFEVHLTLPSITPTQEFLEVCKEVGCKPIILDLDGEQQVTTSSVYKCDLQDIGGHAEKLVNRFKEKGYEVIRTKIETVPWHPVAKAHQLTKRNNCYFESHMTYELYSADQLYRLRYYSSQYGMHLSKNALKHDAKTIKIMGTIRSYDNLDTHNYKLQMVTSFVRNNTNLHPVKQVTEFAIMDTNTALDSNWMNRYHTKSPSRKRS
jgi:hypothetical protein